MRTAALPVLEPTLPPSDTPGSPVPAERLGWLALVGALALFFLLGIPLQVVSAGAGIWFTEIFLFFGFGWALTRWSGRDPAAYLGLSWPGAWPLLFALLVAVANYFAVVIPLQFLAQLVAPKSWVEMFDQTQVFERHAGLELFLAMSGAVAAAPLGEEVIFRGLLLQGLLRRGTHVVPAVVASAAIFSLCHVNLIGLPALFELGLVFGLLYARTRTVLPGMVAHLGSNLTATLLYVASKGQESGNVETSAQLPAVLAASVVGWLLLGVVLALARRIPGAWGEPRERDVARPRVSLSRALAPWAVAASVSLVVWGLADRRGLELDVADLQTRLPPPRAGEPDWVHARRAEVDALRDDVCRGSAPLDSYLRARRRLARALAPGATDAGTMDQAGD
ncbi:MAG TPA: type II CAAX endopeptidase family protein [Myxococcaceae bacterium]|nr:type II CAAX endopeptidase family protein [Myxococcaceae bacterium]